MAIDINIKELLEGEKVICPKCNNGYFIPAYSIEAIKECSYFKCNCCGEELHLCRRIK